MIDRSGSQGWDDEFSGESEEGVMISGFRFIISASKVVQVSPRWIAKALHKS